MMDGHRCTPQPQDGGDLRGRNGWNVTPMYYAANIGHTEVVKYLASKGASVNVAVSFGWTPLHGAATWAHTDTIRALIELGADTSALTDDDETVLHVALREHSNLPLVKMLVEEFGAPVNDNDRSRHSPLHVAAHRGHADIVQYLAPKSSNINAKDIEGLTALNVAALRGHYSVVEALLELGSAINISSNNGYTPLASAALKNHSDVVKLLVRNHADLQPFDDGFSLMHLACYAGNVEMIKFFDVLGVSVHAITRWGQVPAHYAAVSGCLECIITLVGLGASIDVMDNNHETPLFLSVSFGDVKMVEFLGQQSNHSVVNMRNISGSTPLWTAAAHGHTAVVAALLTLGADVDAADNKGHTPLFAAASLGMLDSVKALLAAHANPRIKDGEGLTPLLIAIQNKHDDVAALLSE